MGGWSVWCVVWGSVGVRAAGGGGRAGGGGPGGAGGGGGGGGGGGARGGAPWPASVGRAAGPPRAGHPSGAARVRAGVGGACFSTQATRAEQLTAISLPVSRCLVALGSVALLAEKLEVPHCVATTPRDGYDVVELQVLLTATPDAPALIAPPYFSLHGLWDWLPSGEARVRQRGRGAAQHQNMATSATCPCGQGTVRGKLSELPGLLAALLARSSRNLRPCQEAHVGTSGLSFVLFHQLREATPQTPELLHHFAQPLKKGQRILFTVVVCIGQQAVQHAISVLHNIGHADF